MLVGLNLFNDSLLQLLWQFRRVSCMRYQVIKCLGDNVFQVTFPYVISKQKPPQNNICTSRYILLSVFEDGLSSIVIIDQLLDVIQVRIKCFSGSARHSVFGEQVIRQVWITSHFGVLSKRPAPRMRVSPHHGQFYSSQAGL